MSDFEYYVLRWTDANKYPTVEGDNVNLSYLDGIERLDEDEVPIIKLCFGLPMPSNPMMADYHPVEPVFSKKVSDVIDSFKLDNIQIFDAVIRGVNNELFNYSFVYIYNRIACLDFSKSICEKTERGSARNLEKIVLDESRLKGKPLKERLIFRLKESPSEVMFHKVVVEKIMALNPTGIRFIKVEDYYDGIEFS